MKLPRTKKTKSGQTLYLHTPKDGKPVYVTIPPNPPKLAVLNAQEEAAWEAAYRDGRTRLHYGEIRAHLYAWKQVQKEFPRLRKYDALWNFASAERRDRRCRVTR